MSDTLNDDEALPNVGHNSGDYAYAADVEDYAADAGLGSEQDVQTVAAKTARVAELARLQVEREAIVARLEAELNAATVSLEDVSKRELPWLLRDLNVSLLPLANGAKVKLSQRVVASVRKEDREIFIAWLVKQGYGSLPKRKVTVEFPMGAFRKANMLLGYLKRWYSGFVVTDDETVHAGTLSAWAKEVTAKNKEALAAGGKVLEFPECLTITDLLESSVVVPKGQQVEWT